MDSVKIHHEEFNMPQFVELGEVLGKEPPPLTPEQYQGNYDALEFVRTVFLPPDGEVPEPTDGKSPASVWLDAFFDHLLDEGDDLFQVRLEEFIQALGAYAAVQTIVTATMSGRHPYTYITDMLNDSHELERKQLAGESWSETHADAEVPSNFYVPEPEDGGEAGAA